MSKPPLRQTGWMIGTALGLAVICYLDILTPLGVATGVLYPLAVLMAAAAESRKLVIGVTLGSVALTLLGLSISLPAPPEVPLSHVLTNRLLSVIAIGVTGGMALLLLHHVRRAEQAYEDLDRRNDALAASRQLLDIASESGRIGGWSVDLGENRVVWSDEVARIHGTEPGYCPRVEEAMDFYAPEWRDEIHRAFTRCAREGVPFDREMVVVNTRGERTWIRTVGKAVRDVRGRIRAVEGAFQDINRRKVAEQQLALSEQSFQQLADAMPLIVWTADPEGRVDYFNQAVIEYAGLQERAQALRTGWRALLHPDDHDLIAPAWEDALTRREAYQVEIRLRRDDGQYRWHLVRAEPILDASGQVRKWYGAALDIHDRRNLEYQARALASRLTTTLESISDGFLLLDRQWRFTFVNGKAEKLLDRSRSRLLGQQIWDVFPDLRGSEIEAQYQHASEHARAVRFESYYEPLSLWVDIQAYPSDEGLAIYFQDVTQRHDLEQQLRQAQRLEAVGQLTGGVAHDFNNLLTVMLGNADLLCSELVENKRLGPLAETIAVAARRGSELTQRLLAFARQQPLEPRSVDVNQLLDGMARLLQRVLGEDVELALSRASRLHPALVDPAQLENAVLNLCINARDAMAGGGRLTLETGDDYLDRDYAEQHPDVRAGHYVMLAVSDTGVGIEPEHLSRVFEPFFTTKRKGEGTGLGLSMVFGFMKQTGGHVSVYSEVGQGTTVKLYLPRASQEAEPARDGGSDRSGSVGGGEETILLVEDDDLVRQQTRTHLDALGYRVLAAANGRDALKILDGNPEVDLLFTDVIMPGGLSGRELVDTALQRRPWLKVLYTSGYTEDAIVHHGRLDAGVQLLSKPYRRRDLAQKIRHVLENDPDGTAPADS